MRLTMRVVAIGGAASYGAERNPSRTGAGTEPAYT
jgi:hypothetical protein